MAELLQYCRLYLIFLLLLIDAACGDFISEITEKEPLVSRIAFGSCANQSDSQPIWNAVTDFDPQVFIWLGDNIYGDNKRPFKFFGKERTIGPWKNIPRFIPASEDEMKAKYAIMKNNSGYSRLRKSAKVIGTWDDHDYGLNDAGKEFDRKITNQRLMLDFLDEPYDSKRRQQEGVYASYTFGPASKQVKAILLDTRYHRDPLSSDGTILGDAQWEWLEKELNGDETAITIIGSSIQVVSNLSATTGPMFYMESWGRFPKERNRLFEMIAESKRPGVLFISGDVHFGEITRYDCACGYPLYDITASGITQAVEKVVPRPFHLLVRFLAWFTPNTMRVMDKSCRHKSCTYGQTNFGVIEINWDTIPVSLKFEVRDANGLPVVSLKSTLSELQAKPTNTKAAINAGKDERYCSLEVDLPLVVRFRLLILFACTLIVLLLMLIGLVYAATLFFLQCICKKKLD